ncbi:hypothetical protein DZC34_09415 [Clostridium botulinum]|nr:hypothetical protein DZC34_09415 [Clostridium botulinum]
MKGYRVFIKDMMGYDGNEIIYTTNYQTAVKTFNRQLKKVMKGLDLITDKECFGEIKAEFKEPPLFEPKEPIEIICMKAPYIIHRQGKRLIASVFYDYRCSYEYDEHDTGVETVIIEEIEILN